MAQSDYITLGTVAAEKLRYKMSASTTYYFLGGSHVYDRGEGKFEIYGGSSEDRNKIIAMAKALTKAAATPAPSLAATPAQISYLTSLIHDDPATAMMIGASVSGATVVSGLTKLKASQYIETLKSGGL